MKTIQPHPRILFAAFFLCVTGSFLATQPSLAQETTAAAGSGPKSSQLAAETDEVTRRKQEFLSTPLNLNYIGRLRNAIIQNVVYRESIEGIKPVEIEVRTASDGTVLQFRINKSSGTREWDAAVMNAIQKTARFPLDESGRVPPVIVLVVSPTL